MDDSTTSLDPSSDVITAVPPFRCLSATIDASALFLRMKVDAIGSGGIIKQGIHSAVATPL
jgi:hypothetical protein